MISDSRRSRSTLQSPESTKNQIMTPFSTRPTADAVQPCKPTIPPHTMKETNTDQSPDASPVLKQTQCQTQILAKKVIQHPALTPFRKSLYLALLQIPPGQWTTYAALAKHTNSSARAVGTAMRLNPFAPGVPCHRVLASDRTLGGYMGTPPASVSARSKGSGKGIEKGGNLERKRRMLEEEGVKFDLRGRAVGSVFVAFRS